MSFPGVSELGQSSDYLDHGRPVAGSILGAAVGHVQETPHLALHRLFLPHLAVQDLRAPPLLHHPPGPPRQPDLPPGAALRSHRQVRPLPRRHLQHQYSEAVDVRHGRDRCCPLPVLRRHVPHRPRRLRRDVGPGRLHHPRQPEVGDPRLEALVEQHVAGLDVAVDHRRPAAVVQERQPRRHTSHDPHPSRPRQPPRAPLGVRLVQPLVQAAVLQVLVDEHVVAAGDAEPQHARQVRVPDPPQGVHLRSELPHAVNGVGGQPLHRDRGARRQLGLVDEPEAAVPDDAVGREVPRRGDQLRHGDPVQGRVVRRAALVSGAGVGRRGAQAVQRAEVGRRLDVGGDLGAERSGLGPAAADEEQAPDEKGDEEEAGGGGDQHLETRLHGRGRWQSGGRG
ncbi:unnamed protein product [Musa acuminata subsp. burmannicoides]